MLERRKRWEDRSKVVAAEGTSHEGEEFSEPEDGIKSSDQLAHQTAPLPAAPSPPPEPVVSSQTFKKRPVPA